MVLPIGAKTARDIDRYIRGSQPRSRGAAQRPHPASPPSVPETVREVYPTGELHPMSAVAAPNTLRVHTCSASPRGP
jgi:hypothetical protein